MVNGRQSRPVRSFFSAPTKCITSAIRAQRPPDTTSSSYAAIKPEGGAEVDTYLVRREQTILHAQPVLPHLRPNMGAMQGAVQEHQPVAQFQRGRPELFRREPLSQGFVVEFGIVQQKLHAAAHKLQTGPVHTATLAESSR